MITFTKDLELGVPKIDAQHRDLIDKINKLSSMGAHSFSKEETKKTIDFLGQYVINHFRDEELLQVKSNYPKYPMHKELHQKFIQDFTKFSSDFDVTGPSPQFTLELNKVIITWIVRHIKNVDIEFGKYYNATMGK